MTTRNGIHWLAPASAIAALVAGLLFMLGHHLFYQSLDNTPVTDTTPFDFEVSQQQLNIAIGTAFAFLSKACMVIAISVAFIQIFWYAASARENKTLPSLERIDAIYSVLDNAFEMFNIRSWCCYPLLMLVAGLSWLVPIASIITPATLTVRMAAVWPPPISAVRVPNLDFSSTSYLAQMPDMQLASLGSYQGPSPYHYSYAGPSDDLLKIANAVMGDGEILPIAPPGLNASWELAFQGPSLECSDVDDSRTIRFAGDFVDYLRDAHNGGSGRQYGYVVWYPAGDSDELSVPTGVNCSDTASCLNSTDPVVINLGSLVPYATHETLNRSSKALEMMVLTKAFASSTDYNAEEDSMLKLRRCQLFNATYQVSFDYSTGVQRVNASTTRDGTERPIQHIPGVLHKTMNQQTDNYEYPCGGPDAGVLRCCYNHPDLLRTLSYQAIMDAFTQRFQGAIYTQLVNFASMQGGSGTTFRVNSTLMQTKLALSEDLTFLRKALQSESKVTGRLTFQAALAANNSTVLADANDPSLVPNENYTVASLLEPSSGMMLGDAIEELFRNLTVSLMSSAALQPNYSSPTAPEPAEVTSHRYHNVYNYSTHKLWLPYGIALGLTTLTVIAGLATMLLNRASYSSNFSTILRAAHGAQLSTEIQEGDAHGQDPLPKYLAEAKVRLRPVEVENASEEPLRESSPASGPVKVARGTVRLLGSGILSRSRSDSYSHS